MLVLPAELTHEHAAACCRMLAQGLRSQPAGGAVADLLGPDGAGKTTLTSNLAGLARASVGEVTVQGSDVQADYGAARRKLGVVPQELVFDAFFTVGEALRIQSGYFGVKNNDA